MLSTLEIVPARGNQYYDQEPEASSQVGNIGRLEAEGRLDFSAIPP